MLQQGAGTYWLVVPLPELRDVTINFFKVHMNFSGQNVVIESASSGLGWLSLNMIVVSDILEKINTIRSCLRAGLTSKKMFLRSSVNRYYVPGGPHIHEIGYFIDVISPPVNVRDEGHMIIYQHDYEQLTATGEGTQLIREAIKIPGMSNFICLLKPWFMRHHLLITY